MVCLIIGMGLLLILVAGLWSLALLKVWSLACKSFIVIPYEYFDSRKEGRFKCLRLGVLEK